MSGMNTQSEAIPEDMAKRQANRSAEGPKVLLFPFFAVDEPLSKSLYNLASNVTPTDGQFVQFTDE